MPYLSRTTVTVLIHGERAIMAYTTFRIVEPSKSTQSFNDRYANQSCLRELTIYRVNYKRVKIAGEDRPQLNFSLIVSGVADWDDEEGAVVILPDVPQDMKGLLVYCHRVKVSRNDSKHLDMNYKAWLNRLAVAWGLDELDVDMGVNDFAQRFHSKVTQHLRGREGKGRKILASCTLSKQDGVIKGDAGLSPTTRTYANSLFLNESYFQDESQE